MLSGEEMEAVAGRARTLQERLDVPAGDSGVHGEPVGDGGVEVAAAEHVEEWCENVADGDFDAFENRLAFEDCDLADARDRVATHEWPAGEPLPEWVRRFDRLLEFVLAERSGEFEVETGEERPFVDLLEPFVEYADREVADPPTAYVSRCVADDLTAWLAEMLADVLAHPFFIEFKTSLARHDPDAVAGDDAGPAAGSTEGYERFVAEMLDGGLKEFFVEYSFSARLVTAVVSNWMERVETLYGNVRADWSELQRRFVDGDEERIVAVDVDGDTHQGGRTVASVVFESGTRVAYKPRNSAVVVGFYDLLAWINRHGDLPAFRTLDVLHRGDYCWMEWVTPEPCATMADVEAYYRRAGMLLAVFFALDAVDMHLENIVAVGDQPVAIDLETLAHPLPKREHRTPSAAAEVFRETVARTGILPRYRPESKMDGAAGLFAEQMSVEGEVYEFTDVNTDRMDLRRVPRPPETGHSLPEYDGDVEPPDDHADALVDGFRECYRFVVEHSERLLADDGPIERLADRGATVRVLYRNSAIYADVRHRLTTSSYGRTGLRFGVAVEKLAKTVVTGRTGAEGWPVFEYERPVVRNGNTPRFTARLDSAHIYDRGDVVVEEFFERAPVEGVRERVRSFDEEDLDEQTEYLDWAYGNGRRAHAPADRTDLSHAASTDVEFDRLAADAARAIFDRIADRARDDGGDPTWILRRAGPAGGIRIAPVDDALYDGRVGLGLFAVALAESLGEERYAAFAGDVVAPVLDDLDAGRFANDPNALQERPRPVGGATGLGSIVYGFAAMGDLSGEDRFVRAGEQVAALLDPERIAAEPGHGVLDGSSGAVLGLLKLHDVTGDASALERAAAAGDHLLDAAEDRPGGLAWSPDGSGRPRCGFADGAAGVAYSLARLHEATGASRFREAALAAVAFENGLFDADRDNWPDRRESTARTWMDAWCHGRTGIGLARLGTHAATGAEAALRDVRRALDGVDAAAASPLDHVCCGNFGRVEFLARAAAALDEPRHRDRAERLAAARIRRAGENGGFATQWGTDHWYDPGFFTGEAGIGYALLGLRDPSLPSVLLWE